MNPMCHRPADPVRKEGERARPSCVRADANQAKKWAGNRSAGGRKRTRVRLCRRVGPAFLSAPTQTDGRGRNGSPHWSCSKCTLAIHKCINFVLQFLDHLTHPWVTNIIPLVFRCRSLAYKQGRADMALDLVLYGSVGALCYAIYFEYKHDLEKARRNNH